MLELSPVGRGGTPDEVATVAALLMGPDGAFITGSDVLTDGGVTASALCRSRQWRLLRVRFGWSGWRSGRC